MRCRGILLTVASLALMASPARAEQAIVVMPGNTLGLFDTATPNLVTARPITGLGVNETVRGLDQRPATLELVAVTVTTGSAANSVVKTYAIDVATGAATLVGATATALAGAGDVPTGVDFNPVVDRIRYVNANDENARLNPTNGALAGNDTDLTPAAPTTVIAAAYDSNVKDAETTTLYAIDRNDSTLARQGGVGGTPSPNGGVVTEIGPLGLTLNAANDGGLDVDATGTAYAALTGAADNLTRLYMINLASGAATPVGLIGNGTSEARSLTIVNPKPTPAPAPTPAPGATQPSPTPTPAGPDSEAPRGLLAFESSIRIASFLKSGLRGRISCSEACSISARLRSGKTTLATGKASLPEAAAGRLTLRAGRSGRKALRKRRRTRATLTAVLTDTAGNKSTVTRRVTLR